MLLSSKTCNKQPIFDVCAKNPLTSTKRLCAGKTCAGHVPHSVTLNKSPESLSDELFLEMFKNGTLPHTEWNHYAHVRMCYLLVVEYTKAQGVFWKLKDEYVIQNFTRPDVIDKKTALERLEISNTQDLGLYDLVAKGIRNYNSEVGKDPEVKALQTVGFHATLTGFFTRSVKSAMFNYALAQEEGNSNSKPVTEIERRWKLATQENAFLTHFEELSFSKFADSLDEWIEFGSVFAYYSKSELFPPSGSVVGTKAPDNAFKTKWVFRATKVE